MGKIDFTAMKRQREKQEADIASCTPVELEQSYQDVWGEGKEKIEYIELNRIHAFSDKKNRKQPFKISQNKIDQIKLSVSDIGIVTPLIVRKYNNDYQIISGHHRFIVAKELNLLTVPCIVRDISDDEVIKYVAECNIQRSKLLPTEYAEIYSRYMEMRSDIDMTAQEIADKFGISRKSLYRYVKILGLNDKLKQLIDTDMLHVDTAEIFSDFSNENQNSVYEAVTQSKKKVNRAIAKAMQALVIERNGDYVLFNEFVELFNKKRNGKEKSKETIYNKFTEQFKVEYSEEEWNILIEGLLQKHFDNKE